MASVEEYLDGKIKEVGLELARIETNFETFENYSSTQFSSELGHHFYAKIVEITTLLDTYVTLSKMFTSEGLEEKQAARENYYAIRGWLEKAISRNYHTDHNEK